MRSAPHTYAEELRNALKAAGITRPELFKATLTSRPVDFHSFRRAYSTALAHTNVNAQQAMALAGHKTMSTHMRYVKLAERLGAKLSAPAAALSLLPIELRKPSM